VVIASIEESARFWIIGIATVGVITNQQPLKKLYNYFKKGKV